MILNKKPVVIFSLKCYVQHICRTIYDFVIAVAPAAGTPHAHYTNAADKALVMSQGHKQRSKSMDVMNTAFLSVSRGKSSQIPLPQGQSTGLSVQRQVK